MALVLEHAARSAEHSSKLSLVVEQLREILIEADFCAREAKRGVISRADVDSALELPAFGAPHGCATGRRKRSSKKWR